MARTNDEVAARRAARAKIAKLHEGQRQRDERIEEHLVDAELSRANMERAEAARSAAEAEFASALAQHEERMAMIVAAFRGEKVPVDTIAELLAMPAKQVRSLTRQASTKESPTQGAAAVEPSLPEEQDNANDA